MTRINEAAVRDGRLAAAYQWDSHEPPRKKFRVDPDGVVAMIKRHVRLTMGDKTENASQIYAIRGGFFHVRLSLPHPHIADPEWRDVLDSGINVRRHQVGLVLRALHGEVLNG